MRLFKKIGFSSIHFKVDDKFGTLEGGNSTQFESGEEPILKGDETKISAAKKRKRPRTHILVVSKEVLVFWLSFLYYKYSGRPILTSVGLICKLLRINKKNVSDWLKDMFLAGYIKISYIAKTGILIEFLKDPGLYLGEELCYSLPPKSLSDTIKRFLAFYEFVPERLRMFLRFFWKLLKPKYDEIIRDEIPVDLRVQICESAKAAIRRLRAYYGQSLSLISLIIPFIMSILFFLNTCFAQLVLQENKLVNTSPNDIYNLQLVSETGEMRFYSHVPPGGSVQPLTGQFTAKYLTVTAGGGYVTQKQKFNYKPVIKPLVLVAEIDSSESHWVKDDLYVLILQSSEELTFTVLSQMMKTIEESVKTAPEGSTIEQKNVYLDSGLICLGQTTRFKTKRAVFLLKKKEERNFYTVICKVEDRQGYSRLIEFNIMPPK